MLDKIDYNILSALDKNCRIPLSQLAKKLRISRDVLSYRIKRLEEQGIIEGYLTYIDFGTLGYTLIRLYLRLQHTTPEIEQALIQDILAQNDIAALYHTDGHYDIAIGFLVKDLADYEKPYYAVLNKYQNYIIEKNFSIFIDLISYYKSYLSNEESTLSLHLGSGKKQTLDATDIQLLHLLSKHARMSLLEIGKKLQLTSNAVKYRILQLQKQGVIVAFRAAINQKKLGYFYYKIDLTLEDTAIIPSLQQFCLQHKHVVFQDICIGGSDFECDIEVASKEEFYLFIQELKKLFPQKIRTYTYYEAIKIHKWDYFPQSLLSFAKENAK